MTHPTAREQPAAQTSTAGTRADSTTNTGAPDPPGQAVGELGGPAYGKRLRGPRLDNMDG